MSKNNKVYSVLVPEGSAAVAPATTALDAILSGQIAIIDSDTSMTVSLATAVPRKIVFATGVGTAIGMASSDLKNSMAPIDVSLIEDIKVQAYQEPVNKVVDFKGFTAECSKDYSLTFEIRNSETYNNNGYSQVLKTFNIKSDCCKGCEDCPSGDCLQLAVDMIAQINATGEGMFSAELITDAGDPITEAAFLTANDTDLDGEIGGDESCPGVRVTVNAIAVTDYCAVDLGMTFFTGTDVVPIAGDGFGCTGTFTTQTELAFEIGSAAQVKSLEYVAGGWSKPGPYRVSSLNGVAEGFDSNVVTGETYNLVTISYAARSDEGWRGNTQPNSVIIAVPDGGAVEASLDAELQALAAAANMSIPTLA